ncbi:MAG: dNTP triphosphohydrolase [Chthoniobacteraceae bacterium]
MTNTFYNKFDVATLDLRSQRENDLRTPFQVDRDRIIYSAAFRSLQSKTQVFHTGEYDFYRTRLTHSLEVAQIGRSICNHLLHREPLRADFFIDPDLVEACCLAHDIGHPPFGHAGESALNEVLAEHGGFEGNAQTLRILTHLIFSPDGGMKPTRALLDGVLKYKEVFSNIKDTPAKFIYTDQKEILDFVFGHPTWERDFGMQLHLYRSIECQIMDWADDVAYGLMDIVDGVNAHFITSDNLEKWRIRNDLNPHEDNILSELTDDISKGKLDRTFAKHIGDCITGTSLAKRESLLSRRSNRYALDLVIHPPLRKRIDFYKKLSTGLIFHTPQIKQLEYKGRNILTGLFQSFQENYSLGKEALQLLPQNVEVLLKTNPGATNRLLGDYLSGLTDAACIRIYRRLFDPAYGSFTDLY